MRLSNSGDHRELCLGTLMQYLEKSFHGLLEPYWEFRDGYSLGLIFAAYLCVLRNGSFFD